MAEKQMKVFLNGILLPVPPERITKSIKNQNKTLTTMSGQEINLIRPAGLTEIVLSKVLLPNTAYDFMEASDTGIKMAAQYYLDIIEKYKTDRAPITLTINKSADGLCSDDEGASYKVTLEDYKINQSTENGDDIELEIKLKQYVEFGLEKIKLKKKKTKTRTEKETTEQTYVVKSGDTLWAIAKKFYGDGSLYPYLAYINNISNPNIIHTGQVLKIGNKADALAYKPKASLGTKSSSGTTETQETVKTSNVADTLGFGSSGKLLKSVVQADTDVKIQTTKPLDVLSPTGLAYLKSQKSTTEPESTKGIKTILNTTPNVGSAISVNPKIPINTGGGGGHGI